MLNLGFCYYFGKFCHDMFYNYLPPWSNLVSNKLKWARNRRKKTKFKVEDQIMPNVGRKRPNLG